jgi:hypothetical protein
LSTSSAPSLRLELAPPRIAFAACLTLAALALLSLWLTALPAAARLAAALGVAIVAYLTLRRLSADPRLIERDPGGGWWLHGDGEPQPAALLGASRLGPLLVLRLRSPERHLALVLTPERLPGEDLRRLRASLGLA